MQRKRLPTRRSATLLTAEAFSSLVRQAAAHPQKDMVPAPDLVSSVNCGRRAAFAVAY